MLGQMVRPHEATVADGAAELLLAGVGSLVAAQLVRAGKPATTADPLTQEGTLSCVGSHVSFEVRGLEVILAAVLIVALEDSSSGVIGCGLV